MADEDGFVGWGRFIDGEKTMYGWNGMLQGNCREYVEGKVVKSGWFEKGVHKGDFRKDSATFKYWELDDYLYKGPTCSFKKANNFNESKTLDPNIFYGNQIIPASVRPTTAK